MGAVMEARCEFFTVAFCDQSFINWAGWASVLGCFLICYYGARHISGHPRHYAVLALFATAWVLVLGAINSRINMPLETVLPDRAQDVASLLLVYAGAMLAREAPAQHWIVGAQRWLQVAGLWLMFLLVLPDQVHARLQLSPQRAQLFLGEVLGYAAYLSLALGARVAASSKIFVLLAATLVAYTGIGLARTVELWFVTGTRPYIGPGFAYAYIAARLATTALFTYIVVKHAETQTAASASARA